MEDFNLVQLENTLWLVTQSIGVAAYDFDFERYFSCRHPLALNEPITAIARMGAAQDYPASFQRFCSLGIRLIHTPEQYALSSEFYNWYPLLADLTPRSVWFDAPPNADEIERQFRYPIFVKGHRQTNRHRSDQSIIQSRTQFERLMNDWSTTPMLAWQKIICREFVPLRPVAEVSAGSIPKSFEFRTFCWRGRCVGIGRYWSGETYHLTDAQTRVVAALSEAAAGRLKLPFVVVDIAQAADGRWIVIEINDAQDSGYGGVSPHSMWSRIVEAERSKK